MPISDPKTREFRDFARERGNASRARGLEIFSLFVGSDDEGTETPVGSLRDVKRCLESDNPVRHAVCFLSLVGYPWVPAASGDCADESITFEGDELYWATSLPEDRPMQPASYEHESCEHLSARVTSAGSVVGDRAKVFTWARAYDARDRSFDHEVTFDVYLD